MEGVRAGGGGEISGDDRAARERERERMVGEIEVLQERLSHMQDECTQVLCTQKPSQYGCLPRKFFHKYLCGVCKVHVHVHVGPSPHFRLANLIRKRFLHKRFYFSIHNFVYMILSGIFY